VSKRLLKNIVNLKAKKMRQTKKVGAKLNIISKSKLIKRLKKKKVTNDVVIAAKICVNGKEGGAFTFMPYLKEDLHGI
jgi:hypothetical protein